MRMFRKDREDEAPLLAEEPRLSGKDLRIRVVFFIIFLLIGITALTYAISGLVRREPGWQSIRANSEDTGTLDKEFDFHYFLGDSGVAISVETRRLKNRYTELVIQAYRTFHAYDLFPGVHNPAYLNAHINEVVTVDETLYRAFEKLNAYSDRRIFLAPVYEQYQNAFFAENDDEAGKFDPLQSQASRDYYAEAASFAVNPEKISMETLGNFQVRLKVSDDYRAFAKDNGFSTFIDFFWMKNAFIVDYIADTLMGEGYTRGILSSFDGFIRNMDESDTSYSFNIFDRVGKGIFPAARFDYTGRVGLVYLRNYKRYDLDAMHYYTRPDGSVLTSYISPEDGLPKSAANDFVAYSRQEGCADVLLRMIPVYFADHLGAEALAGLKNSGLNYIFCDAQRRICHSDAGAVFADLFNDGKIAYSSYLVP